MYELLILLLVYTMIAVSETDTDRLNKTPPTHIQRIRTSENIHQMVS